MFVTLPDKLLCCVKGQLVAVCGQRDGRLRWVEMSPSYCDRMSAKCRPVNAGISHLLGNTTFSISLHVF